METVTKEQEDTTLNQMSKDIFMKLVQLHFKTSILAVKRSSIHLLEEISVSKFKKLNSYKRLKRRPEYKISQIDGKNIVTLEDNMKCVVREILPFSRIFDVLMASHVRNGHEVTDYWKAKIEKDYDIPSICFDLIPKVCNICAKCVNTPRVGIVTFLHNMIKHGTDQHACDSILIYCDQFSEYLVLRPTRAMDEKDVMMEIFQIFLEFGPPEKVYINYKPVFNTNYLTEKLRVLFPGCKFIIECWTSDEVFAISSRVMNEIISWMSEAKSESWEIGCPLVQNRLNSELKPGTECLSKTARDLFFNRKPFDTKIKTTLKGEDEEDGIDKDIEALEISIRNSHLLTDKETKTTPIELVNSSDEGSN